MHLLLSFSLYLALFLSGYAIYTAVRYLKEGNSAFLFAARHSSFLLAFSLFVAAGVLVSAFLTDDFSLRYVAEYSNRAMPAFYKFSALWAGQPGSLLLWAFILSLYIAAVSLYAFYRSPKLTAYVLIIMQATELFFLAMLVYISPPFEILPFPPQDGSGLNPLLQNPWMVLHPPTLYIGYVGLAAPFAFCMGALLMRSKDTTWIVLSRKFTLFAWLFLGTGILFGAQWAYLELGWGGYWGWDPVENASFMPWLMSTAFLHSVMITEYRQMLKVWNVILVTFAFGLSIFGTFVTRSGVVSSVHSFTQSKLGPFFFVFLALLFLFSFALLFTRWKTLREEEKPLESYASKESAFLFNNLVFAALCFAVFWGTIFPMISEAITGTKITVGPPYFNQVTIPLFLVLLLLTGIGPLIAWRKATLQNARKHFILPGSAGLGTGIFLFLFGLHHIVALVSFSLCAFVIATIVQELFVGVKARYVLKQENPFVALYRIFLRNPRRYGGYIVHLGIVLIFIGATGEGAFKHSQEVTLRKGESTHFYNYTITFQDLTQSSTPNMDILRAKLKIVENGTFKKFLYPEKNFHENAEQPMTEVAILSSLRGDLYTILIGLENNNKVLFKFYYNPLIAWLWFGGMVVFLGGLITLLPLRLRKRKRSPVELHR